MQPKPKPYHHSVWVKLWVSIFPVYIGRNTFPLGYIKIRQICQIVIVKWIPLNPVTFMYHIHLKENSKENIFSQYLIIIWLQPCNYILVSSRVYMAHLKTPQLQAIYCHAMIWGNYRIRWRPRTSDDPLQVRQATCHRWFIQ